MADAQERRPATGLDGSGTLDRGWFAAWRERHQTAVSFWLHVVGIPVAVAAIPLAVWQLAEWRWDLLWRPVGLLAAGYLLQWIGHRYEGNDVGEVILIKRMLGMPYVAVSPRFAKRSGDSSKE